MSAKRKKLTNMSKKTAAMACSFCFNNTDDEVNFGKLKTLKTNLRVHYYCVVSKWPSSLLSHIILHSLIPF